MVLEQRLQQLEAKQERAAVQVKDQLRDMLEPRLQALEKSIQESARRNQADLDAQREHVEELRVNVDKQALERKEADKRELDASLAAARKQYEALEARTTTAVGKQNVDLESGLKAFEVKMSRELREIRSSTLDRIEQLQKSTAEELNTGTRFLDRKYGDVCVGLDEKLNGEIQR